MQHCTVEVKNKLGLHTRAAARLVATASEYESAIELTHGDRQADAKSIMAVMMLAAAKGSMIEITSHGADEENALQAVVGLINNYFGEDE